MNGNTFQKILILICVVCTAHLYAADWTQVNRQPGGTFRDVVYAAGLFVAVGDDGLVRTSPNGTSWTQRNSGVTSALWSVCYGQGLYAAVGPHGLIITSSNGSTWTQRKPYDSNADNLCSVASNDSDLFVAVGNNGMIRTSPDGITWTDQSRFSTLKHYAICWGNGRFVIGSASGSIYTSTDGVNWGKASVNTGSNNTSTIYAGGLYVVGGHATIYTSTNGTTWTARNSGTDNYFHDLTYTGSDYIGCGNSDGYGCSMIQVSPTTVSWVRDRTPDYSTLLGIANDGTTVVAVGTRRLIITNTVGGVGDGKGCGVIIGKSITVTAPNGGEQLGIGSSYTIKWSSNNVTDNVRIRFSSDNGANYSIVADSTPNDGSYSWTVPNVNSSRCLIRINAVNVDGTPNDVSNGTFTIGSPVPTGGITITSPNGGENLTGNTIHNITWNSTTKFSKIDIEYYNGSKWNVIVNGTADDGVHSWTVPNISTTQARLWIKGYDGASNPTDYSDSTFSISQTPTGSLTITSPNGGEIWAQGSTENITWTSSGTVGNVKLSFSIDNGFNWTTIVSSTSNDGVHSWSVPNTTSDHCLVKINSVSNAAISDISNNAFIIGGPPEIVLNKNRFNFGAVKNGATPCTQTLFISNGGGGTFNWTATSSAPWLILDKVSGNSGESVTISVNPAALGTGSYMGTVTVSAASVENSPQTADIYLTVKNASQDQLPFGEFATPLDGTADVTGSIAVTGWVLDDICLESVKIYREVGGGLSFIGDAVFVEGARPDVEVAYPDYPYSSRAGWGYMLLTNFLPDGNLVLKAIARDTAGHQVVLGTKTIIVDNAHAIKPFGAIDSPTQGGSASGAKFRNNGWALTPNPNKIPVDGSTINVFVDGTLIGKATYDLYREDIAGLFPGYANSNGAWAYLDFDTTAYTNGVHTIAWSVTDDANNNDGIGSRYFSIQNTGGSSRSSVNAYTQEQNPGESLPTLPARFFNDSYDGPIRIKTGYNENTGPREIYPGKAGTAYLEIHELERIEIEIAENLKGNGNFCGYLVVNNELRPLPIGSTLDSRNGIFRWQPGPGFLGDYEFVFREKFGSIKTLERKIQVKITPKYFEN